MTRLEKNIGRRLVEDIISAYPNLTIIPINAVLAYAADVVSNETPIAAA